jgi:hypothetical protein
MKLHGAAYVAPACLMTVAETGRWRRSLGVALAIGVAALIAFALPFLPGGVSVADFLFHIGLAARHGLSVLLLLGNLTLLTGISLPILILAGFPPDGACPRRPTVQPERRPALWRLLAGTAFGCALTVAVIASKPGAGYPHLLPFVPYAALILSRVADRPRNLLSAATDGRRRRALSVSACCFSSPSGFRFWCAPRRSAFAGRCSPRSGPAAGRSNA